MRVCDILVEAFNPFSLFLLELLDLDFTKFFNLVTDLMSSEGFRKFLIIQHFFNE